MADKTEFLQAIDDAILDADSLEQFINGSDSETVLTRLSAEYPTLQKAIKELFENGGLPATPFKTKALMTASVLDDGKYALVTDDADNNGLYVRTAGTWVKSDYSPESLMRHIGLIGDNEVTHKRTDLEALKAPVVLSNDSNLAYSNTGFSYIFNVEPLEKITVYVATNASIATKFPRLLFYKKKPDSWGRYSQSDDRIVLSNQQRFEAIQDVQGKGFYMTFVVPDGMHYMAYDSRLYDRDISTEPNQPKVVIKSGDYNEDILDDISGSLRVTKRLYAKEISVESIDSPSLNKNKNLFNGYTYGKRIPYAATVDAENEQTVLETLFINPNSPSYKTIVGCYIVVEPNTTYTISKQKSSFFSVALLKDVLTSTGYVIHIGSDKKSLTLKTRADTGVIFIYLSPYGETPLVQVEKGSEVTDYSTPVLNISDKSNLFLGKLTQVEPATSKFGYISLGARTDEFVYPYNSPKWTESSYIDKYYEPLLSDFPHLISKEVIGRDGSDTYNLVKYIFEPDHYEQTVLISSGMHPTEAVPPFALGELMNEIYRNPNKHPMLDYMRSSIRFIVIPTLNPWGMNVLDKKQPQHYVTSQGANLSRSFNGRWYRYTPVSVYDPKGEYPWAIAEANILAEQMRLYKDDLSFIFDCHTGENWANHAFCYWLDDDRYLKPAMQNTVSKMNDVWKSKGVTPKNETIESDRIMNIYYSYRTLGVPAATIEYGAGRTSKLSPLQIEEYVDQLFNYLSDALKANIPDKMKADKNVEHNKPYVSLYNFLDAHNDYVDEYLGVDESLTKLVDSTSLVKEPIVSNASSDLVKLTHTPSSYDSTVVVMAGVSGAVKKDFVSLLFTAYKFMTDDNPYVVGLRENNRVIFVPYINKYGIDNATKMGSDDRELFGPDVASSQEPELVDLRAFLSEVDAGLVIQLDALGGISGKPFPSYSSIQAITDSDKVKLRGVAKSLTAKYSDFTFKQNKFGSISNSYLSGYLNTVGSPYLYLHLVQHILPKREPDGSGYVDYGYEPNEMSLCSEMVFNAMQQVVG